MYGVMSYLNVDGDLLMVKKSQKKGDPNSGLYTLPGGKLEPEEKGLRSVEGRLEATIRETKQETGITLVTPKQIGIILFDNEGRIFNNWPNAPNYLVYIFSATNYRGQLIDKGDERETPLWVPEYEIPELPKNPGDTKMYEWIKNSRNLFGFFGVIRHKGREIDEENTWVDFF